MPISGNSVITGAGPDRLVPIVRHYGSEPAGAPISGRFGLGVVVVVEGDRLPPTPGSAPISMTESQWAVPLGSGDRPRNSVEAFSTIRCADSCDAIRRRARLVRDRPLSSFLVQRVEPFGSTARPWTSAGRC